MMVVTDHLVFKRNTNKFVLFDPNVHLFHNLEQRDRAPPGDVRVVLFLR